MARGFGGVNPVRRSNSVNIVIFTGVVFALVFVVLAFVVLSKRTSTAATTNTVVVEKEAPIKMVEVLVPVREIPQGTALEPAMFRRDTRPQVGVDARSLGDFEEIKGHFARSLIIPGQPLNKEMITSVRPANALTANIPEGYRAVTIRVDARTSVEGFAQPGAKVDVHWTSMIKGQQGVKVIVQNAKVLSAERIVENVKPGAPIPSTVTLLVSAKDAAKIQLASTTGTLSLTLRGDLDAGKGVESEKVTINDLLDSNDPNEEHTEGTVTIGGKQYKVTAGGKMVPANP